MRLLRRTLSLLRRRNSSDLVLRCFLIFEYTCVFLSIIFMYCMIYYNPHEDFQLSYLLSLTRI